MQQFVLRSLKKSSQNGSEILNYKITNMVENEFKSKDLSYSEKNTDTDGKIIKRKTINVNIDIEYFIPKKNKNNNDTANNANITV